MAVHSVALVSISAGSQVSPRAHIWRSGAVHGRECGRRKNWFQFMVQFMAMLRSPPSVRSLVFFFFFFFFCVVLTFQLPVHGQSQEGFISIDCGIPDGSAYRDPYTGIQFLPDTRYIDGGAGESKNAPSCSARFFVQYGNVRSFPDGRRNCYSLWPVRPGGKYLIRAGFCYGNYDGKNSFPVFDLYVGVNLWAIVRVFSDDAGIWEIITVAPADSISVCLVNTGNGSPFISTLELRPLPESMYVLANPSQSLVNRNRWNYGANSQLRYPYDRCDRVWFDNVRGFVPLNSTREVTTKEGDGFRVPAPVMRTAVTVENRSHHISMGLGSVTPGDRIYVILHFAEVEELMPNETRRMDIFEDGQNERRLLYGGYSPPFMVADEREANITIEEGGRHNIRPTPPVLPSSTPSRVSP